MSPTGDPDCSPYETLLAANAVRSLEGEEKVRIDAHLVACAACREVTAMLGSIVPAMTTARLDGQREPAVRTRAPSAWVTAGAFAAGAAVASLAFMLARSDASRDVRTPSAEISADPSRVERAEGGPSAARSSPCPDVDPFHPKHADDAAPPDPLSTSRVPIPPPLPSFAPVHPSVLPPTDPLDPWSTKPKPPAAEKTGTIVVMCQPLCESVVIDGVARGASPLRLAVPTGTHLVIATGKGQRRASTVTVRAGETSNLRISLGPEF